MKEKYKNILNNQESYSSDIDEYSFTVHHKKLSANVILKLDISSDENVSKEDMVKNLVTYINTFEKILTCQSEK